MKCQKCGAELSDDTKFCSFCGTKIESGSNPASDSNEQHSSKPETSTSTSNYNGGAKAPNPKQPSEKKSIADSIKEKGIAYWNNLSIFGKVVTVAIVVFSILCLVGFLSGKVFAGILSLVQIALAVVAILMHKGVIKTPYKWAKYAVILVAILFTVLNISSYSWSAKKSSSSPTANNKPAQTTTVTPPSSSSKDESVEAETNYVIEKDSQYAYMSDEWNVYIATAISDSLIKVENWNKTSSSSKSVKFHEDIGSFKINDSINGFSWIDDDHTAFYITLKDKNNSRLKSSKTVLFTINISDSDTNKGSNYSEKIACYTYTNDDWHMYRAIPLTENLVKIEVWYRSSSLDKFLYGYDMCVIDSNNTDTDFAWTDDEHTSFTITTKDPANSSWKSSAFVAFITEKENYEYSDVKSFLGSKIAGEGELKVPSSSSSYKYKDYKEVQDELATAGFTSISTKIQYDIVFGWTDEGEVASVSIDGKTDFEQGAIFKQDAPVVITYHMKEEDDPAKASEETTKAPETTPEPTQSSNGVILPQSGTKLAKDLDTNGTNTVYYINVDGTSNVPKLSNWGDAIVTDSVSEYLDYLQSQGYTVTVTGKDYREPYSGFHAYDTNFKVSNGTTSWTMSLFIQDEKYVEYELDINLK